MIILTIALWTMALIIFLTDKDTEASRWGSASLFFGGMGGFSAVWEDNIIPLITQQFVVTHSTLQILNILITVFSAIQHYFMPYALLMYGIAYSEKFPQWQKKLSLILLLPIVLTIIIYPYHSYYFMNSPEKLTNYYKFLSLWGIPYLVTTIGLIIYTYLTENNFIFKRSRLLNVILVVPVVSFIIFANYVFRFLGIHDSWRYDWYIIVFQFIGFLIFAAKYGIWGVRIKFERENGPLRIINTGTSILNHTIKNELLKISLSSGSIKGCLDNPDKILEYLSMVDDSVKHLAAMVKRVHEQSKYIVVKKTPHPLEEIINAALKSVQPHLRDKSIVVNKVFVHEATILCDEIHLKEMFINILKNSIEAMDSAGIITIEVLSFNKKVIVIIQDTGRGISKENIRHVLDPFFTTKLDSLNFGLGLSYCFNVMKHHEGSLEIHSEENSGTSIVLTFPKKLVVDLNLKLNYNGLDQEGLTL